MLTAQHGLIVTTPTPEDASMRVFRPDGASWVPAKATIAPPAPTAYDSGKRLSAFSNDGRYLAVSGNFYDTDYRYVFSVYDTQTWTALHSNVDAGMDCGAIGVSDAGKVFYSHNSGFYIYDLANWSAARVEVAYEGAPSGGSAIFTADGAQLLIGTYSGVVVYETATWTVASSALDSLGTTVYDLKLSAGGSLLLAGAGNGPRIFSWPGMVEAAGPLDASDFSCESVTLSPDGAYALFTQRRYSAADPTKVYKLNLSMMVVSIAVTPGDASNDGVQGVELSPDGSKYLTWARQAAGLYKTQIRVFDATTHAQELLYECESHNDTSRRSAMWLPTASLKRLAGTVRDDAGAPVARAVRVTGRTEGGIDIWTASGADGAYSVIGAFGGEVNRIVYDGTGALNDLIDRVVL